MRACSQCGGTFSEAHEYCPNDGLALGTQDLLIGSTIGSYRVTRLLGEGGMGRVYLGEHQAIGARVAVKVLSVQATASAELVERFFREAQLVNHIRHEGIVNVLDLDYLPDGRPFIVMECLEGMPLSTRFRSSNVSLGELVDVVMQVLDALQAAHEAGVVHRDLKPDNVFVSPKGRTKLLDFGIAKLMPTIDATAVSSTKSGALLGTPAYMAPEQVVGGPIAAATDIYAVGVMLYQGATGRLPFRDPNLYGLMAAIVEKEPIPPSQLCPQMGLALENIILSAMAKDPSQRPRSARAMSEMLGCLVLPPPMAAPSASRLARPDAPATDQPPSPSQAETGERAPAQNRSTRRSLLLAAGAVGLVGALGVSVTRFGGPAPLDAGIAALAQEGDAADDEIEKGVPDAEAPVVPAADAGLPTRNSSRADTMTRRKTQKTATGARGGDAQVAGPSDPPPEPATETSKGGVTMSGVTIIETGKNARSTSKAADFSPTRLSLSAYLPKATQMAKELYGDVYLVEFAADGVGPDGTANLTLSSDFEATYRFLSPSHSASKKPRGVPDDRPCWVYVELSRSRVEARIVEWDSCKGKRVAPPRCSMKEVWKRALAQDPSLRGAVAKITYDSTGWFVNSDGVSESVPDDC